ncbi:MAG: hypothetical protein SOZ49_08340 [Clostridiaceae bacterium]|nr:hypothetical protein [Clostridiaceae bacterium]
MTAECDYGQTNIHASTQKFLCELLSGCLGDIKAVNALTGISFVYFAGIFIAILYQPGLTAALALPADMYPFGMPFPPLTLVFPKFVDLTVARFIRLHDPSIGVGHTVGNVNAQDNIGFLICLDRLAFNRQANGIIAIIHNGLAVFAIDQGFSGPDIALLRLTGGVCERCRGQNTHDHHDRKEQRPKTFLHVLSFLLYFPLIRVCMCSFRNCGISLWHTPPEKIRRSLFSPFDSEKV